MYVMVMLVMNNSIEHSFIPFPNKSKFRIWNTSCVQIQELILSIVEVSSVHENNNSSPMLVLLTTNPPSKNCLYSFTTGIVTQRRHYQYGH